MRLLDKQLGDLGGRIEDSVTAALESIDVVYVENQTSESEGPPGDDEGHTAEGNEKTPHGSD